MKITLILSFVLCCVIATAQEPVQLEVWTTVKSYGFDLIENPFGVGSRMAYVPNFRNKEIPHGFVISYREPNTDIQGFNKTYTWAFTKPNDTINRFSWPRNFFPYATPDMNGDSQRDFMNGTGVFYLGTDKDEPDTLQKFQIQAGGVGYAKMNNDNCDDLYYYGTSPAIVNFVFGNSQAGTYQTASVISTYLQKDSQLEEEMKAVYKNKQGQWRLLTQSKGWTDGLYERIYQSKKSALRLYALEFTVINTDSTIVTATQIDEYKDPKWLEFEEDYNSKDPSIWSPFNSSKLLYQSEHYPKTLYYASMNTMPDKDKKYDSYATFFDLTNDKIVPSNAVVNVAAPECKILKHSIDGDNREDMYVKSGPFIYFYSVDATGIIKNTLRFTLPEDRYKSGLNTLQSIADINNDGLDDIALMSSDNTVGNYFAIVLGKNILTHTIEESDQYFSIGSPYPLPNSSQLTIPLRSEKNGLYSLTLFSVQGSAYPLFVNKEMSEGKTDFMMDISPYSSGNYILRFSDGKTSVENNIIITH